MGYKILCHLDCIAFYFTLNCINQGRIKVCCLLFQWLFIEFRLITNKKYNLGVIEMLEERARQEGRAMMEEERALMAKEHARKLMELKYRITENLLTQTSMSISNIASIVGVSEYFVRKVKRELNSEAAVG